MILAEGHVVAYPDAEVIVGAEMAGTVTRVMVQEKSVVKKGDLLVAFRGDEIRAAADEAVARVSEVDAELALIEQEQLHLNRLAEKPPGPDEAGDKLKARWNAARARRAAAAAGYKRIEAEFARTRIRAPIDGVVVSRTVNPGETVNLGTPLLRIVDLKRLRIEAEIDEYDIPRCAPGCSATITAPGYSGVSWQGTIEEIADVSDPPPDPPRRPRPPHRHPRPACSDWFEWGHTAQARAKSRSEDRGSRRTEGRCSPVRRSRPAAKSPPNASERSSGHENAAIGAMPPPASCVRHRFRALALCGSEHPRPAERSPIPKLLRAPAYSHRDFPRKSFQSRSQDRGREKTRRERLDDQDPPMRRSMPQSAGITLTSALIRNGSYRPGVTSRSRSPATTSTQTRTTVVGSRSCLRIAWLKRSRILISFCRGSPLEREAHTNRAYVLAAIAHEGEEKRLRAAERDLEKAGVTKNNSIYRATRGIIAAKRGDFAGAIPHLSWAIEHGFDTVWCRSSRFIAYVSLGNYERAITDIQHLLKIEPSSPGSNRWLGYCHAAMGKPELALADYAKELQLNPEDLEAIWERFTLALSLKKPEASLEDFDRLIGLHPDHTWAICSRGLIRWFAGRDLALVKEDLDKAIKLDPQEWSFSAFRAAFDFKRTDYARALDDVCRCCLVLRRTQFEFCWNIDDKGDGHGRLTIAISWHHERAVENEKKDARPDDLDHRLAVLGLKALWALACR